MRAKNITFSAGNLILEGVMHLPRENETLPAVVLCHPHPLYGGSMDNNVILSLSYALVNESLIVLRFNFRGVGKSEGEFANGIGEQEDVIAAIDWLVNQPNVDCQRIGLAGYSFGALVALSVAFRDSRISALSLISPPLKSAQIMTLKKWTKPKFVIFGSNDFVVSAKERELISQELEPDQLYLVPGADHFWWGYEEEVARKVSSFFASHLKSLGTN